MKTKTTTKIGIICTLAVAIAMIFATYFVSAVAVSGAYTTDIPLKLYAGQSESFVLTLQNMAGEGGDVKFKANITEGSEVAKLIDSNTEYLVPFGANNVTVNVRVDVPANAKVGDKYLVKVAFDPLPVSSEEEGMVQILLGLSRYFNVEVIEKPAGEKIPGNVNLMWIIIPIIVVIIIIIILVMLMMKRKSK